MNRLEGIGAAQLLAHEGQRQLAVAIVGLLKRAVLTMVDMISRSSPGLFVP